MSGPYQRWDLSNCGAGRLCVENNCSILSVNVCFPKVTTVLYLLLGYCWDRRC